MRMSTKWIVLTGLVLVTTGAAVLARQETAYGAPACSAMSEWVAANRSHLPKTYKEIIRYPLPYRKSILSALSPEVRRQMWSEQYALYRRSGLLTPRQIAFLDTAEAGLKPIYANKVPDSVRAGVAARVTTAALAVLGRDLTHRVLFVLGPAETAGRPETVAEFREALANPLNVRRLVVNCTCYVQFIGPSPPECGDPGNCFPGGGGCTEQNRGCGPGGEFPCDGECQIIH